LAHNLPSRAPSYRKEGVSRIVVIDSWEKADSGKPDYRHRAKTGWYPERGLPDGNITCCFRKTSKYGFVVQEGELLWTSPLWEKLYVSRYCWRISFKVLEVPFLAQVAQAFFAFQEGMWDTQISALLNSPTVIHEPGLSTAYENSGAIFSRVFSRWREILACNDNVCGESKGQNSHKSLLGSHS
jgi:hypothetical protein